MRRVRERMGCEELTPDSLVKIMIQLMDKFDLDMAGEKEEDNEDEDSKREDSKEGGGKFKYPYKQLLIWSVLMLRYDIAYLYNSSFISQRNIFSINGRILIQIIIVSVTSNPL
jgi:hypothetical protein